MAVESMDKIKMIKDLQRTLIEERREIKRKRDPLKSNYDISESDGEEATLGAEGHRVQEAKRAKHRENEDIETGINYLDRLPEELLLEIVEKVCTNLREIVWVALRILHYQLDKPQWLKLSLTGRKFRRILNPLIWKTATIYLENSRRSVTYRGLLRRMDSYTDVLSNIEVFTHHLAIKVRQDLHDLLDKWVELAIKAIGRCPGLVTLDLSGSQLSRSCWDQFEELLLGNLKMNRQFRSRIERIQFPSLEKSACGLRVYSTMKDHGVMRTQQWPRNYLRIAPLNAFFEFETDMTKRRPKDELYYFCRGLGSPSKVLPTVGH